jgi:putative transposase
MGMPRSVFTPFDERNAVRIYQRSLPHWRQEGATYFVTFRLGDSVPLGVFQQWEYEKQVWLAARGIRPNQGDGSRQRQFEQLSKVEQHRFHKHFNRRFHVALDEGRGACHLNVPACLAAVRDSLFANDGSTYDLGDFVVMPNHVHLLLVPSSGSNLERLLKAIKGAAAWRCNQLLGRSGRFWQPDSYDHIVRSMEQLTQYQQYIAENPRKAGISVHADAMYHADWMNAWHP